MSTEMSGAAYRIQMDEDKTIWDDPNVSGDAPPGGGSYLSVNLNPSWIYEQTIHH